LALITGGEGALAKIISEQLILSGFKVLSPCRSQMDVSDEGSVKNYFNENITSDLDLLINNAGTKKDSLFLNISEEEWDEVIRVNLRGAFLCSKLALKFLCKNRSGHIINIGSFSAISGPVGQTNYAASKAGLISLTQSLAQEGGKRNVRSNCILPGWLETQFTADVPENVKDHVLSAHALNSLNTPESVAAFVLFIHTQMPSVSGQIFQLDSRIHRWA
jgi:3-oxoacyl-[acyl-carrier protein] reductase